MNDFSNYPWAGRLNQYDLHIQNRKAAEKEKTADENEIEVPVRLLDKEVLGEQAESTAHNQLPAESKENVTKNCRYNYGNIVQGVVERGGIVLRNDNADSTSIGSTPATVSVSTAVNPLQPEFNYPTFPNSTGPSVPGNAAVKNKGQIYCRFKHGFYIIGDRICFFQSQRVGFDPLKDYYVGNYTLLEITAHDAKETGRIYVVYNTLEKAGVTVLCKKFDLKIVKNLLNIITMISLEDLSKSERELFLDCFLRFLLKKRSRCEVPRCKGLCKRSDGSYWPLEREGTRTYLDYLREAQRL